jgi:hypothetical protein
MIDRTNKLLADLNALILHVENGRFVVDNYLLDPSDADAEVMLRQWTRSAPRLHGTYERFNYVENTDHG